MLTVWIVIVSSHITPTWDHVSSFELWWFIVNSCATLSIPSFWQILLEAIVSKERHGYIAIDDIMILNYPCCKYIAVLLLVFPLAMSDPQWFGAANNIFFVLSVTLTLFVKLNPKSISHFTHFTFFFKEAATYSSEEFSWISSWISSNKWIVILHNDIHCLF